MKFLLDESADFRLRAVLIQSGHEVFSVSRDIAFSTPDAEVLAIAVREAMVIITEDPDFGELVMRQHHVHAGILLF